MKPKLRWLLLIVPLALFVWAYQAAAWRPKLVGVQPASTAPAARVMLSNIFSYPTLFISPDGRSLASTGGSRQNYLMMWSVEARQRLWQHTDAKKFRYALAFSPDSQLLAVALASKVGVNTKLDVALVETATGQLRRLPANPQFRQMRSAAFASSRELVFATAAAAFVVDTRTGKVIRQWKFKWPADLIEARSQSPQSQVSADGSTVLALNNGKNETRILIYDVKTGAIRGSWRYNGLYRNPSLAPDGELWVMTRPDKQSFIGDVYDARSGQKLWGPLIANATGLPWTWSADGQKILFQTTLRQSVAVADARTMGHMKKLAASANNQALALAPNGDAFYSLDDEGKIWRWRAR